MTIKLFLHRLLLITLFVGALYSTITSVTNLSINDLKVVLADNTAVSGQAQSERRSHLQEKELNTMMERKEYISSEQIEGPKSLDDVINFEQYPKKKVIATGYTAGKESTGKSPGHPQYGITYSGVTVKRDLYSTIAADLSLFPLGTILYIPEYGYGVVADIGGAIKGNKIDLYYPTVEQVYNEWGKRELDVYVISEGKGKVTEEEIMMLNEDEALQVFRDQIN